MGLRDSIREYFDRHPRAKKVLGVATVIAANFAVIAKETYPLLHESSKDLVKSVVEVLREIGDAKADRTLLAIVKKMKEDSSHKTEIIKAVKSLEK